MWPLSVCFLLSHLSLSFSSLVLPLSFAAVCPVPFLLFIKCFVSALFWLHHSIGQQIQNCLGQSRATKPCPACSSSQFVWKAFVCLPASLICRDIGGVRSCPVFRVQEGCLVHVDLFQRIPFLRIMTVFVSIFRKPNSLKALRGVHTVCLRSRLFTLGDSRSLFGLTSKIPPLGPMLNFDAGVTKNNRASLMKTTSSSLSLVLFVDTGTNEHRLQCEPSYSGAVQPVCLKGNFPRVLWTSGPVPDQVTSSCVGRVSENSPATWRESRAGVPVVCKPDLADVDVRANDL